MPLSIKSVALIATGTSAIVGGSIGSYYLLQDKTIKHKLIREGYTLISNNTEYQVAFKEFKETEEFRTEISTTQKPIVADSEISGGGTALKTWCEDKLETNLSDEKAKDLTEKLKKYCVKPPLTIGEKISKDGWTVITDWSTRFGTIKSPDVQNVLLNDLKTINDQIKNLSDTDQTTKAVTALEQWCTKQKTTELIKDTKNETWGKVEKRCLEKKTRG